MLTITRDAIDALDAHEHDIVPCDVIETPTGLILSTRTEDGDPATIGVWHGVYVVTVSTNDPWGRELEHEFDGFSTLADAVEFAQGFSWGDVAP